MSSGSESDDDYVPKEPEQLSEEGSADEETDLQFEQELEHKSKKRKVVQASKGKKRQRTRNGTKDIEPELEEKEVDLPQVTDPEEEKKREEDLWAKFLEGTDTKPKPAHKEPMSSNNTQIAKTVVESNKDQTTKDVKTDNEKERERRIFEFAGETIVVENNVIKEKIKTTDSPAGNSATGSKLEGPSPRNRGSGLSGVLNTLNKKNTLSTLEKSKLDWVTYKKQEGIEEEIESHNKGKTGYLDRQDFLERADLREYEIERELRMNRRSKR